MSTGYLLWQTSNMWQRGMRAALDPQGLTHVQFLLLAGLQDLRNAGIDATQVKLARHVGTDVMMTSKVLRSLEKRRLVGRKTSQNDLRANALVLTAAGEKTLQKAQSAASAADKSFFRHLLLKADKFGDNLEALLEGNRH